MYFGKCLPQLGNLINCGHSQAVVGIIVCLFLLQGALEAFVVSGYTNGPLSSSSQPTPRRKRRRISKPAFPPSGHKALGDYTVSIGSHSKLKAVWNGRPSRLRLKLKGTQQLGSPPAGGVGSHAKRRSKWRCKSTDRGVSRVRVNISRYSRYQRRLMFE